VALADYFLEFSGPKLEGESLDSQFKNCIQIDSWSWTGTNASTHYVGQGGGAGKVMHGDLQCQKWLDKASIVLFDKLNKGQHFGQAILHCRKKSGDTALEFLTITMTHVTVSNVSLGGHSNATGVSESISLAYEEVKFEYKMQNPDGSKGATTAAGWSLSANKAAA
jgi:type VI secretion system secreted protein Hcp